MRKYLMALLTSGFLLAGCAGMTPEQIADLIKAACHIAVPAADILKIIDAEKGAVPQEIVNVVCSAYKSSVTSPTAAAAADGPRVITVHVNGKDIQITVTPAK